MAPRKRQPSAVNAAIIDTDVVSMLFNGDSRAQPYRIHLAGRLLGISFMTLAELERWQLERNWGTIRKEELAQHLRALTDGSVCPTMPCNKLRRTFRGLDLTQPRNGSVAYARGNGAWSTRIGIV